MAEIYTSAASANQGHLSPDASDHINSVLSDLGLGGTSGDSSAAARSADAPVETTSQSSTSATGIHDSATAPELPHGAATTDPGSAILVGSTHDAATSPVTAAAPEPVVASPAAPQSPLPGADSLSASHAATGADAFGGLGTDTLWGSDAGSSSHITATPAAGGDTIRSSGGGMETIYGGNATIYASGHATTLNTDTVHASGDGTTMDGSASHQALDTGGASSFEHLPGGSGSDTIILHDTVGSHASAATGDAHTAYDYGLGTDPAAGTHDATYLGYGSPDSVVGGDGSDHFGLLGYDGSAGGHGTGSGDDGSTAHDPYFSGGQVTHSDAGTFVSYHDGYGTGYTDADHLKFKDTVMAG